MLTTAENNMPSKSVFPSLHMITNGGVKTTSWKKGKGKSNERKKVSHPRKKQNIAKDPECFHCGKIGHWKRNYPFYLVEGTRSSKRLEKGDMGTWLN
ncbi:zinc finger, CCHC-type containing protein [Tanacetum coccineum]